MYSQLCYSYQRRSQRQGALLAAVYCFIIGGPFRKSGPAALQACQSTHKGQYVRQKEKAELLEVVTRRSMCAFVAKRDLTLVLAQSIHNPLRHHQPWMGYSGDRHDCRLVTQYENISTAACVLSAAPYVSFRADH